MKNGWMVLGAIMISSISFAQKSDSSAQQHGKRNGGETMKTVLSLDDAQYNSIKEINKKYSDQTKAKMEENRKEMKDLQDKRQAEVDKLLTPEQKTKWHSYKQGRADERRAQFHRRHGDHRHGKRGERHDDKREAQPKKG